MRVANILQDSNNQANPANILCLTFTEAAARNMRERLSQLIGEPAYHVGIYTFHGFGSEVIQRYPEYFADQPLLKPVEELGAYELLSDIFERLPRRSPLSTKLSGEFLYLKPSQDVIGWFKRAGLEPADLAVIEKANQEFIQFAKKLVVPVMVETTKSKFMP